MIRTKLANLHISPIMLHFASTVRISSSVNSFFICFLQLDYLLLGHLLSGSILNHLMDSKDVECILSFLMQCQEVFCCTHLCTKTTITSSANGRQFSLINNIAIYYLLCNEIQENNDKI